MKENGKTVAAVMYDFDNTLSTKDMQEYAFIPGVGMDAQEFWKKCDEIKEKHHMDQILAYMYVMVDSAEGKMLLNRNVFHALGKSVELFDGVASWFGRANKYAEKKNIKLEHYVISSGLKEIIEGTKIAHEFKRIYAAEFFYDDKGVPKWPAMAVNYTSKTQFLFRINKNVLDVTENDALNQFTPEDKRRIPFRNMIYIGDGLTDVPCMKLVKVNGGHSIAVFKNGNTEESNKMILDGRVDYTVPADYSKSSELEKIVFAVIDQIAACDYTIDLHLQHQEKAKAEWNRKKNKAE
jgi:2-hydroxy-3-keto-5-methylthiopentenyl-1-phosphate phosphatase